MEQTVKQKAKLIILLFMIACMNPIFASQYDNIVYSEINPPEWLIGTWKDANDPLFTITFTKNDMELASGSDVVYFSSMISASNRNIKANCYIVDACDYKTFQYFILVKYLNSSAWIIQVILERNNVIELYSSNKKRDTSMILTKVI
ncbi:MAG: hypothetical protein LKE40_04340 [Spirochaetia bacterium]|jgi:hypothetical protein|nr:hypothetical protein [Spirochaetia bacterium]